MKRAKLIVIFDEKAPVEYINEIWKDIKTMRLVKDAWVEYEEVGE